MFAYAFRVEHTCIGLQYELLSIFQMMKKHLFIADNNFIAVVVVIGIKSKNWRLKLSCWV